VGCGSTGLAVDREPAIARYTTAGLEPVSDDAPELPFGLYERLVTRALNRRLLQFDPTRVRVDRRPLDHVDAPGALAKHVERILGRALDGLPPEERVARQSELANSLLNALDAVEHNVSEEYALIPAEELCALQDISAAGPLAATSELRPPLGRLSASDLLVNARGEPGLAHNLALEIPSADSIDLLCAFVRWHGLRILEAELRAHCRAGKPLRVITTVYTGSTERKALDWLVELGANVRVSYDTQSTRLHAKAWRFRRASGYSTAYIGSSNLSKSALLDGVEWNVRLSEVSSPDILEKFQATFESYWADADYEPYSPERDRDRIDRALSRASGTSAPGPEEPITFFDIEPRPYQEEMLERLAVERERHHRHKNLIVAATGTGKTIVSALDFKALRAQMGDPTLLFVAHRQEILKQSVGAFRQVLRDNTFGELYVDGHRPTEGRHVFASVQSLAQLDLKGLPSDFFDVVVVDEFHHAAATTYARLLGHLRPDELIGLTATPERADGESILHYFDEHISVELRLWDALERGLLCPFQYFGLNDQTDLSSVQWSRKGYDIAALERIYTGDDARVRLVLQQVKEKLRDPGQMRALGFCVSIAHAQFMAARFSQAGLPSAAVSANTDSETRRLSLQQLQRGQLRAIFAVDIFNEGVDLPAVDTLLFLRPTESAVVFMQQLGRGLRRFENKDCVTVLDFIGQSHRRFRFDFRYRAITGASRVEVEKQVQADFPFLPAGCTMQLDKVAKEIVLGNLRSALPSQRPAIVRELRSLAQSERFRGRAPKLREFLEETGLELDDVYKSGCWSGLQRSAGLPVPTAGPHETVIGDRLSSLLHIDDELRLSAYRKVVGLEAGHPDTALLTGLHFAILQKAGAVSSLADSLAVLHAHPAIVAELQELLGLLDDRSEHLTYPLDDELRWAHHVPLSVHARHSTDEILTGFGLMDLQKKAWKQTGVLRDERTNSDIFLVTLEKSERDYSPSTRYKDYAISMNLFHWESQSTHTQRSKTGQRYINHQALGGNILLFVRQRREDAGRPRPYTFLGPVDHVSHQGERPISFVWRLRRPMPADFFKHAKVVGG
jgi:superfamily II DNA or RNA helicase/HKD family nuclease